MGRWRQGHPEGRKFALVLTWFEQVPHVGQYDPPSRSWIVTICGKDIAVREENCIWCSVPYHDDIDASITAVETSDFT